MNLQEVHTFTTVVEPLSLFVECKTGSSGQLMQVLSGTYVTTRDERLLKRFTKFPFRATRASPSSNNFTKAAHGLGGVHASRTMTPSMESPPSPSPSSSGSPPASNIASVLALTPATPASAPASSPASPSESDLPQALSLHRILCLHPRERLLLHPVKWTSRHLELLNCSFELPSPAVLNRARLYPPSNERKAAGRAHRLATAFGLGFRMRDNIVSLLENESGPLISVRFVMHSSSS